jgi:hypothetical protein
MDTLSFTQRVLLATLPVVVTALLAGLIVPLVLKIVEARKAETMKLFEAALARQGKIIDSQASLLDDLTKALWAWRYQLMRVTYAGAEKTEEALAIAWNAYDSTMWDSLHAIRVQTTRSRRLISQQAHLDLLKLYGRIVEVDQRLCQAMQLDVDVRRRELGDLNHEVLSQISKEIDDSLHMVAIEVRLVSSQATTGD